MVKNLLMRFVDRGEQYGRHIIIDFVSRLSGDVHCAVDLGVGGGGDLAIVRERYPDCRLIGIDFTSANREPLRSRGIELSVADIEKDVLPIADGEADLIIANQIFEHVKEIFWVNHQLATKLRPGGWAIIGTPNIGALHNRLLFIFGAQPSQMKTSSAHIRGFTYGELARFYDTVAPGVFTVEARRGAQFYPFPPAVARILAGLFPSLAQSVFYLIKKTGEYRRQFLEYPVRERLETNFFVDTIK